MNPIRNLSLIILKMSSRERGNAGDDSCKKGCCKSKQKQSGSGAQQVSSSEAGLSDHGTREVVASTHRPGTGDHHGPSGAGGSYSPFSSSKSS